MTDQAFDTRRFAYAASAFGAVMFLWLTILTKTIADQSNPVFVTVSLKTLLEHHVEDLGRDNITGLELQQRSDAYVAALEHIIAQVASEDDVIVLVSEAVVSDGVVDLTPDVARLADELIDERARDDR